MGIYFGLIRNLPKLEPAASSEQQAELLLRAVVSGSRSLSPIFKTEARRGPKGWWGGVHARSRKGLFGFSKYQPTLSLSNISRVSYNSIRLEHSLLGSVQTPWVRARSHKVPPRFQEPIPSPRSPGSPHVYLSDSRFGGSHDPNLGFNDSPKENNAQDPGTTFTQGRVSLRVQPRNHRGAVTGKAWGGPGPGHWPGVGRAGAQSSVRAPRRHPPRQLCLQRPGGPRSAPSRASIKGSLCTQDRSSPWPLTTDLTGPSPVPPRPHLLRVGGGVQL